MASESDPLAQVYDALFALPWTRKSLCELVKRGARKSLTDVDANDPELDSLQPGDLPQLRLVPVGIKPHLQRTSTSTTVTASFVFVLVTGQLRADKLLFPVQWELVRSVHAWLGPLTALTWKGHAFVHGMRVPESTITLTNQDAMKGAYGWVALMKVEVDLNVPRTILEAED